MFLLPVLRDRLHADWLTQSRLVTLISSLIIQIQKQITLLTALTHAIK